MRDGTARNPSSAQAAKSVLGLTHKDCLSLYFRQAKLLWGSGTLTRRDRTLLDQLRVGLHLSVIEAAKLESAAARVLATDEELQAEARPLVLPQRAKTGPWLLTWHQKASRDPA
jgi:hypothetical protein